MFRLAIPRSEFFNEETSEFETYESSSVELEHSLLAVSKWESLWKTPFFKKQDMTTEQLYSYIYLCQTEKPVSLNRIRLADRSDIESFISYMEDSHTATWFSNEEKQNSSVVTSELIYFWMFSLNIDISCERWHINRLITLIRIFNEKNNPNSKKMTLADIRKLNEERRSKMRTNG